MHKIQLIKPLVSKVFYELNKDTNKDANKIFIFLISGGSQGAKIFDELIKEVMIDLAKNYSIKVIQQTNKENIENLKNFYNSHNIINEIFIFEKNFIDLINRSDFCITRAGATSLAEISIMNKPFLTIPLPTSKDNHQMENARFYEEMGCCWVLDQKNLNKEKILNILWNVLQKGSDYTSKKSNLKKLNYQNSWNDVNQKLKKIIYEN